METVATEPGPEIGMLTMPCCVVHVCRMLLLRTSWAFFEQREAPGWTVPSTCEGNYVQLFSHRNITPESYAWQRTGKRPPGGRPLYRSGHLDTALATPSFHNRRITPTSARNCISHRRFETHGGKRMELVRRARRVEQPYVGHPRHRSVCATPLEPHSAQAIYVLPVSTTHKNVCSALNFFSCLLQSCFLNVIRTVEALRCAADWTWQGRVLTPRHRPPLGHCCMLCCSCLGYLHIFTARNIT